VEEPTHQTQEETQVEEETIKSQLKINIRAKGMINLQLNVTIVRNMVITYMNVERNIAQENKKDIWFLDPRCNNHMA
jgi:hypothetical protein